MTVESGPADSEDRSSALNILNRSFALIFFFSLNLIFQIVMRLGKGHLEGCGDIGISDIQITFTLTTIQILDSKSKQNIPWIERRKENWSQWRISLYLCLQQCVHLICIWHLDTLTKSPFVTVGKCTLVLMCTLSQRCFFLKRPNLKPWTADAKFSNF